MAAEMLLAYYDRSCDSSHLFRNLKIAESPSYSEHLNQYDVIFLNIQQFLRKCDNISTLPHYLENKVLSEIREIYPDLIHAEEDNLPDALSAVYANSPRCHGFVFIIDEWDCIFRVAKENTAAQKTYLDFLRDLFKDRTYVKVAYMTGILPVKKYGTHIRHKL